MKITLVGHGTRGDVQPYICVGDELRNQGHEVPILAPRNMRSFVERTGLTFRATDVDVESMMREEPAQRALARGDFLAFGRFLKEEDEKNRAEVLDSWLAGTEGADLIVAHPLAENELAAIGAARRIPILPLYLYPLLPTREFPPLFLSTRSLGPFNRALNTIFRRMALSMAKPRADELRRRLGLPPLRELYFEEVIRRKMPLIFAFSKELAPRPADYPRSAIYCDGIAPSTSLKARLGESGLDEALAAWLEGGRPPFYLGFGSMPVRDPESIVTLVREVLEELDARAVIGAGWARLATPNDPRLTIVGNVDHAALFARSAGAIHHGGAGTTYASLRAGLPTFVLSVFADQPYWGKRVERLGVGTTIPFKKSDKKRILAGLRRLSEETTITRARALGEKLRREDGAREVAEAIEKIASTMAPPE